MQNKIALEEHFASQDTIGDSEHYFDKKMWSIKKPELLDFLDQRLRRMDACGRWRSSRSTRRQCSRGPIPH
jgi:hypothetical protein